MMEGLYLVSKIWRDVLGVFEAPLANVEAL